jgi:protein-S-isoprenylcysteine O-methyltransferase Ste14
METVIRNIISFLLPITVLIIVPVWIEKDTAIKHSLTFAAGVTLIFIGLYIMGRTISSFIKNGRGTLAPWSPTKHLIVDGFYSYVRNPMIIGVMTVLIGESIAIVSIKIFVWSIVFFTINTIFSIVYEEPDLERKFGDQYREYKKRVPRWIPKFKSR